MQITIKRLRNKSRFFFILEVALSVQFFLTLILIIKKKIQTVINLLLLFLNNTNIIFSNLVFQVLAEYRKSLCVELHWSCMFNYSGKKKEMYQQ